QSQHSLAVFPGGRFPDGSERRPGRECSHGYFRGSKCRVAEEPDRLRSASHCSFVSRVGGGLAGRGRDYCRSVSGPEGSYAYTRGSAEEGVRSAWSTIWYSKLIQRCATTGVALR